MSSLSLITASALEIKGCRNTRAMFQLAPHMAAPKSTWHDPKLAFPRRLAQQWRMGIQIPHLKRKKGQIQVALWGSLDKPPWTTSRNLGQHRKSQTVLLSLLSPRISECTANCPQLQPLELNARCSGHTEESQQSPTREFIRSNPFNLFPWSLLGVRPGHRDWLAAFTREAEGRKLK